MRRQGSSRVNLPKSDAAIAGGVSRAPRLAANSSGAFPIRIARDGTWFYRGSPIRRVEIARLFSTVLRRDADGRYWLETPAERGTIEVEDAPFNAVELAVDGAGESMVLRFRTSVDEWVTAGPDHPIAVSFDAGTGEPSPYVRVRDGLDALIGRSVFYELAALAVPAQRDGRTAMGVWSGGAFFELGESE